MADADGRVIRRRLREAGRRRMLRRDLLRRLGPLGPAALGAMYVQPLASSSASHATTAHERPWQNGVGMLWRRGREA
jgi:hypothetical protein